MDCVACQVPLSMGSFRQEYWCELSCPPSGDLPNPEIEPRSPTLQTDSLPSELPGKPKNTQMGSVSLLQQVFLTQESNWGLLHCRRIFYQLSYQGSPAILFAGCPQSLVGYVVQSTLCIHGHRIHRYGDQTAPRSFIPGSWAPVDFGIAGVVEPIPWGRWGTPVCVYTHSTPLISKDFASLKHLC